MIEKEPEKAPEEPEKLPDTEKAEEEPVKEDANGTQTINKDDCTPVQGLEEPYEITEPKISARGIGTWLQSANGRWWYLHHDGGYTINGWENIDGAWYYFDGNGWMMTGWVNKGSWYYLSSSGAMVTGWQKIDGSWYYFHESGRMMNGWINTGSWYYLASNGIMLTGWQKIDGNWYYLGTNGAMQSGWVNTGSWYYLRSDGIMVTGWQAIDGQWYYFNGSGVMLTGWLRLGEDWYYLESSGIMKRSCTVSIGGGTYTFSASGLVTRTRLNVTRYEQEKSNWCWAASAEMVGKYKNPNSTRTQTDIVKLYWGIDVNWGGTHGAVKGGIQYVSGRSASIHDRLSNYEIQREIVDQSDPYAIYLNWTSSWLQLKGHYAVVRGYNIAEKSVNIIDPWMTAKDLNVWYSCAEMESLNQYQTGEGYYENSIIVD